MKKKWLVGFVIFGLFVLGIWYFMKGRTTALDMPTVVEEKVIVPTPSPTPVPISKDTDLNRLLDVTTPKSYEEDFKNLTESVK